MIEPANPTSLLELRNLSCARGERDLFAKVSFDLTAGECGHIVGANGSGKTSLLRIIAGLADYDEGDIFWSGMPVKNNPEFIRSKAYVGHSDGLKNELTAAENLAFYQQLDGVNDAQLVDQHLARMGLLASADLLANRLSFGQRRRLALARLLSTPAKLWLLDEPFTGIDQTGRELIEAICVEHLHQGGAIMLTNHRNLNDSALGPFVAQLKLADFSVANEANYG